jgi:5-methylcytosine-specific restriction endonuclease McrA
MKIREWRHSKGISKKYIERYGGKKIPAKIYRQQRRALMKIGGELPIERIQKIYEDNIKKYGTLTCIYCLNPVQFGKDTLEHKQPLSRGGTNLYENLAIACQRCNSSKGKKTEKEYGEEVKSGAL